MTEADRGRPERQILEETDHPEFGKCVTFLDRIGLGMQIGKGDETFIVRPVAEGFSRIEAPTEAAKEAAKRLFGRVVDWRGGHR